ncbi:trypsin-like serine peptidase [uncultured Jatrophihabitans sp.]|uniref:trypsin-like serine peptidase n=1 Tax=uncultured Jatrophihabitans sp. TaxID=1610747 RepID=UPI0035CC7803
MLRRLLVLTVALLAAVGIAGVAAAPAFADDPGAPPGTPTATNFGGVPSVGAVFDDGLANPHSCSASVVLTPRGGLVLTAAHCIAGSGAGLLFAPGYVNGRTPYGVWTVQKAWVSPRWVATQDPKTDYAFLQVAPQTVGGRTVRLQDVTGGSLLGVAPRAGTTVTSVAYPYGIDDEPIQCVNTIVLTQGYPTFNCHGYPGGTSGSPFLLTHRGLPNIVVGLIGGLNQGGCYEWNSFSSPFGRDTYMTYLRAATGRPADTVPSAGSDGC